MQSDPGRFIAIFWSQHLSVPAPSQQGQQRHCRFWLHTGLGQFRWSPENPRVLLAGKWDLCAELGPAEHSQCSPGAAHCQNLLWGEKMGNWEICVTYWSSNMEPGNDHSKSGAVPPQARLDGLGTAWGSGSVPAMAGVGWDGLGFEVPPNPTQSGTLW